MIKRHPEPLLWMLFSAGGVLSAMVMPILVFLFGVAFPVGWLAAPTHEQMLNVLTHPVARLVQCRHASLVIPRPAIAEQGVAGTP